MSDLSGRLSGSQAISGSLSGGSVLRGGLSMGGGVSPELLLDKADVITDTASGSIVSISDGMASPVIGLSVDIEPIQDLHGYDNPWPAGGGKNKFDISKMANTADITVSNGVITVTGNAKNSGKKLSELANLIVGETYMLSAVTDGTQPIIYLYGTDANVTWGFGYTLTITQAHLDALVFFYGGANETSHISDFMIRLSSVSDASFAPYSNICPISGRSEVSVTRTGKNIFDKTAPFPISSSGRSFQKFIPHDKTVIMSLTDKDTSVSVNGIYFGFALDPDRINIGFTWVLSNGTYSSAKTNVVASGIYAGQNMMYLTYYPNTQATLDALNQRYNIQIQYGSIATAYEPYQAQTVTIQLGQTVYGGTVDVTEGKLTITHKTKIADGVNVKVAGIYADSTAYTDNITDMYNDSSYAHQRDVMVLCDKLKATAYINIGSTAYGVSQNGGRRFIFNIPDLTTVAQYNAWLQANTPTVWYLLADPIEVILTAEELDILFGDNNVWADSGDATIQYRADTKRWILKKIAQALNT